VLAGEDSVTPPSFTPFEVDYYAFDFPPGTIKRIGTLSFTSNGLAHALFTTGRAPGNQFSHGSTSFWEFVHRATLIPAYIRRDHGGGLVRSRLALELDRSEKVAVSYALGQALTGIFCQDILSTPFLMHVDRYASRYGTVFGATRRRADLFGYRATLDWVVAEAKGRSNSMESDLRGKLVTQKRSVISIAGAPPALALGCVASFPPPASKLRVDAFDPEMEEVEPVALDVDLDRFMLAYYEPFIVAIDTGVNEPDQELRSPVRSVRFQTLGLRIGLLRSIEERVRLAIREGDTVGLGQSILSQLATAQSTALFADGSLIETDWEEALTRGDWQY
jgi:hypothetical protein